MPDLTALLCPISMFLVYSRPPCYMFLLAHCALVLDGSHGKFQNNEGRQESYVLGN